MVRCFGITSSQHIRPLHFNSLSAFISLLSNNQIVIFPPTRGYQNLLQQNLKNSFVENKFLWAFHAARCRKGIIWRVLMQRLYTYVNYTLLFVFKNAKVLTGHWAVQQLGNVWMWTSLIKLLSYCTIYITLYSYHLSFDHRSV